MWQYNNSTNSDELYHFGILGMKWGKRKYKIQNKKKQDEDLEKKLYEKEDRERKAYNKAVDYANKVLIPKINKKYSKIDLNNKKNYEKYEKEYFLAFDEFYKKKLKDL